MPAPIDITTMISYRSTDIAFAKEILRLLREHDIPIWIDREGIKPGTKWRDELFCALKQCRVLIVVLSKGYLASENCRMEVFIARSFGRRIVPIMIDDCFSMLSDYEETKGLEDIFMLRMHHLNTASLPMDRSEALQRVVNGVFAASDLKPKRYQAYVSYCGNTDGAFATQVAQALSNAGIPAWVATQDVQVGENWRDAQAKAMMTATSHVIILDENIVRSPVLRTEMLLSEALNLDTFTVLPPQLQGQRESITRMMQELDTGDQTYRRLTHVQFVTQGRLCELIDLLHTRSKNRPV